MSGRGMYRGGVSVRAGLYSGVIIGIEVGAVSIEHACTEREILAFARELADHLGMVLTDPEDEPVDAAAAKGEYMANVLGPER